MLRLLVLVLLLVNGVYFAWARGLLQPYGYAPVQQSEPQRLEQQIRPEALVILNTAEARRGEMALLAVTRPPECLQVGLYDDKQSATIRQALESGLPVAHSGRVASASGASIPRDTSVGAGSTGVSWPRKYINATAATISTAVTGHQARLPRGPSRRAFPALDTTGWETV